MRLFRRALILAICAPLLAQSCIEIPRSTTSAVENTLNEITDLSNTADFRSEQALKEFQRLPDKLSALNAHVMAAQMTEFSEKMIGSTQTALSCWTTQINAQLCANTKAVAAKLAEAVATVNQKEAAAILARENRRRNWLTAFAVFLVLSLLLFAARKWPHLDKKFARALRDAMYLLATIAVALLIIAYLPSKAAGANKWEEFLKIVAADDFAFTPILLEPNICKPDNEVIVARFTDTTEKIAIVEVPSENTLTIRGYALRRPDPAKLKADDPYPVSISVINKDPAKTRDITSCLLYSPETSFQIAFDDMTEPLQRGDQHLQIKWNQTIYQYNIEFKPPLPPSEPPPSKVVSMRIGGETKGENEDGDKGLQVLVFAKNVNPFPDKNVLLTEWAPEKKQAHVAHGWDLWWTGTYKNEKLPTLPLDLSVPFVVPDSGLLWVRATKDHHVNASFHLEWDVETYRWGTYVWATDEKPGYFTSDPDGRRQRSTDTQMYEFRWTGANNEHNVLMHAFPFAGQ